jgi:HlyD family secretion protein
MNMKANWRTTSVCMVLSLLVGAGGSFAWPTNRNEPSKVEQTLISVRPTHVSALGTIAPKGRIRHVAAPSSFSRVGSLLVEEGDRVTQGQVLAHSDDHRLRATEFEAAEAQVDIAQSKLDQLLAGPDPHEIDALAASLSSALESLEQRKREFERASALTKSKSISQEEFESTKLRVALATWAVQELESKQKLLKSVREEDVRVLRAELRAAISRVATASQNLSLSEITSPIHGVVLRVHVRDGERPSESGILELGDPEQPAATALEPRFLPGLEPALVCPTGVPAPKFRYPDPAERRHRGPAAGPAQQNAGLSQRARDPIAGIKFA